MIVGSLVGFPAITVLRRDTIWRADFTQLAGGAAPVLPGGVAVASGAATERTVQTGPSTVVTDVPQNQGRIGRTSTLEAFGLVVEEARTNRWPLARDVEALGQPTIAAGSGATYTASGVVGPDGAGTPKRLQVTSGGYSRYFSQGAQPSVKYTASWWVRTLSGSVLNQTMLTATAPYTFAVETDTTAWQRRTVVSDVAETNRNLVPLDGRDWNANGGVVAGARDGVVDLLQLEDGGFPTETILTTSTRSAEFLSRPTVGSSGQIQLLLRFRPKGDRSSYSGTPHFFSFGTGTDRAYFDPANGKVTVICNGVTYTTLVGMEWQAGDVVDLWVQCGNTTRTRCCYRVNGGSTVLLGESSAVAGAHTGSGTFYLLNQGGSSNTFSCWLELVELWRPGRTPAWVLAGLLPEPQSVLWWLRDRDLAAGEVAAWSPIVGGLAPTGGAGVRPFNYLDGVEFDGTNDALTQAAGATTNPDGATQITVAFWVKPTTVSGNMVLFETAGYPNGVLVQSTSAGLQVFVGTLNCQTTPLVAGIWQFCAVTFDLTRPVNQRARAFRGEPTVVESALAYDNVNVTSVPVASGTAAVGGRSTVYFQGSLGDIVVLSKELTIDQLRQVADETNR